MSIGNLKDTGNQGNNYPWQYKVLLGLDKIFQAFTGNSGSYLAPQTKTAHILRTNGAATLTNISSISIANVGTNPATVNGVELLPTEIINLDAGALNNIISTISYDADGTTLLIAYLA